MKLKRGAARPPRRHGSGFTFAQLDLADRDGDASAVRGLHDPARRASRGAGGRPLLARESARLHRGQPGRLPQRPRGLPRTTRSSTSSMPRRARSTAPTRKMPFSCTTTSITAEPLRRHQEGQRADGPHLRAPVRLPTTGLRFFTVYGPWGRPDMALFMFAKASSRRSRSTSSTTANMQRDFTYVDDIVEGVVRAARQTPSPTRTGAATQPDPATSVGALAASTTSATTSRSSCCASSVLEERSAGRPR